MAPSTYGHDHFSDRAQAILWEHSAFNNLPAHVRSLDCGAFLESGVIISTGNAEEFFLLTEFVAGKGYFKDLDHIRNTGVATDDDLTVSRHFPIFSLESTCGNLKPPDSTRGESAICSATASASWGSSTIIPQRSNSLTQRSSGRSSSSASSGAGALKAASTDSARCMATFTRGTSFSEKGLILRCWIDRGVNGESQPTIQLASASITSSHRSCGPGSSKALLKRCFSCFGTTIWQDERPGNA